MIEKRLHDTCHINITFHIYKNHATSLYNITYRVKSITMAEDDRSGSSKLVRTLLTGERKQHIIKVRVRKKVSIPLKAPEAPLFKYVN